MDKAQDPNLLQNIANLLNVIVQNTPSAIPTVLEMLPHIEGWRTAASAAQFGHCDLIANIASLYLQIAIRTADFPDQLSMAALDAFPPSDLGEAPAMCGAIIEMAGRSPAPDVLLAVAMAIARYAVSEDSIRARVPEDVRNDAFDIFRAICQQSPGMARRVREMYSKQRAKLRKIDAVLGSK
jgi:hypothetical protein